MVAELRRFTMSCNFKNPPMLQEGSSYEAWKKDVQIWSKLTDLGDTKQALAIHLTLSGRARVASSELDVEELEKADGLKKLIDKLDAVFLADKGQRQFSAFNNLYNFRRPGDSKISTFITEFEHCYFSFTKLDMTLPDTVLAFVLLADCNLSENERQLVMSAITDVSYDKMKAVVKRIFCSEIQGQNRNYGFEVKAEPTLYNDNAPVLYSRGGTRVRPSRGKRGGYISGANRHPVGRNSSRNNPVGIDGNISRCLICDSKFHWARNCPHAYENKDKNDGDLDESIHLSLFMGYTNGSQNKKLETLVMESSGCAVLDTGCTTTVCGHLWYQDYMSTLSEQVKSTVTEEGSEATFTFGDGVTVSSMKKTKLPCYIGGLRSEIVADVVDCNIPLLVSKRSLKKAKAALDFSSDILEIGGQSVVLKTSTSGHYLLPLNS